MDFANDEDATASNKPVPAKRNMFDVAKPNSSTRELNEVW